MARKYNFEIIFKKLEEVKEEQSQIENSDYIIIKEIDEQIEDLKRYYEDLSDIEMETYTRS